MILIYIPLIILTLICLAVLTYQDIKNREINIIILIIFVFIAITYLSIFVFKNNIFLWKIYFLQLGISFVFLAIIYVLGKISNLIYIGEGDLYTILAISFTNIYFILFPIVVFIISLLLTLFISILFFIYNLINRSKSPYKLFNHLLIMFLGIPLDIRKINNFYTPLEQIYIKNKRLVRKARFVPNIEPSNEIKKIKEIAKKNKIRKIWVSPLVPFIFSILFGYLLVISLFIINNNYILFIRLFSTYI